METGHPSTRAVNSGSGNRALAYVQLTRCYADIQLLLRSISYIRKNVLMSLTAMKKARQLFDRLFKMLMSG